MLLLKKATLVVARIVGVVFAVSAWLCALGIIANIVLWIHGALDHAFVSFTKYIGVGFVSFVFTTLLFGQADELAKDLRRRRKN